MKNTQLLLASMLFAMSCMGQLKPLTMITQSGDTLKFPLYISIPHHLTITNSGDTLPKYSNDDITERECSYIQLIGCHHDYSGYCDSLKRAMRINFKDTITYKNRRGGEHLKINPVLDYKGNVVRIVIDFSDLVRFRNQYKQVTFLATENKEINTYMDTLIYKETVDALNEGHINWYIPSDAKEGQYFLACKV